jgi:hypothetical protein
LLLATLAFIALIAEPNAARNLTATAEVTQAVASAPPSGPASAVRLQWRPFGRGDSSTQPYLDLSSSQDVTGARTARARLGLDGTIGLGHFASALSSSFARWSIGIGIDAPTPARPLQLPGASDDGLLVAHVGHGLYLGHPPAPRAEIFSGRDYIDVRPSPFHGAQIGIDGTLFLTPHIGLRFDASGGSAMYGGLSLIWRPGK